MTFPVDSDNDRAFDPGWEGEVFICDIDRTYLYTRFSSLKGLARIPFEFAVDKQEIEGMVPLLQEVRRGPDPVSRHTPIYFISASPAQLRPVIQRKMLIDGLEYDGTIFKDWIGVVASLRLGRLSDQLGYKLTALLSHRRELPAGARQVLIGDDLESDALAYTLFSDLLAGRLEEEALVKALHRHGVSREDVRWIWRTSQELAGSVGPRAVSRAYIRLERNDDPGVFRPYWPRLAACRGAFQLALGLRGQGCISTAGVIQVAEEMTRRGLGVGVLEERFSEACARGLLGGVAAGEVLGALSERRIISRGLGVPALDPAWSTGDGDQAERAWTPADLLGGS